MTDWNAKYAASGGELFGVEPNEYLRQIVARSDFEARTGLCLADGNGRNSCWLAQIGLGITALDISSVAVAQARTLDAANDVSVERQAADLAVWAPPAGRVWDAAFIFYLQCDAATRLRAVSLAVDALVPGGWLVVEAFAKAQASRPIGPSSEDNLFSLAELGSTARRLEIVEALEGVVALDEGRQHRGQACVVRFAARRLSG